MNLETFGFRLFYFSKLCQRLQGYGTPKLIFNCIEWETYIWNYNSSMGVLWKFLNVFSVIDTYLWKYIMSNFFEARFWRLMKNQCNNVESLTSHTHLHAMIRTHFLNFDIRFWPIQALMSKTYCQSFLTLGNFSDKCSWGKVALFGGFTIARQDKICACFDSKHPTSSA